MISVTCVSSSMASVPSARAAARAEAPVSLQRTALCQTLLLDAVSHGNIHGAGETLMCATAGETGCFSCAGSCWLLVCSCLLLERKRWDRFKEQKKSAFISSSLSWCPVQAAIPNTALGTAESAMASHVPEALHFSCKFQCLNPYVLP